MHPFWVDTIAGAFGGCLGVLAGSPIDVVRTRLQQSNQSHTGFFSLLQRTVSREGPFALYRGLTYPLISAAAQNAVGANEHCGASEENRKETFGNNKWNVFFAGCFAGGMQCIVTVPQEGVKIKQQLQTVSAGQKGYVGPLQLLSRLGLTGIYHGTGITLARDVPSFGAYFLVYKVLADAWDEQQRVQKHSQMSGDGLKELLVGGIAGVVAWASIYPLDVLKSRVQARGCSVQSIWSEMVASKDTSALTRGMGATLTRAWLVNAAIFWGYSMAESLLLDSQTV